MSNHSTTFYNPVTKTHDFPMHANLTSLPHYPPPQTRPSTNADQFHQNGYFQPPPSASANVSPAANHESGGSMSQQHGVGDVEEISPSAANFRPANGGQRFDQQHNGSSKSEMFGQQGQGMRCDPIASYPPPIDHSASYPVIPHHQGPWYPGHPAISPADPALMFDSSGYPRGLQPYGAAVADGKMGDVIGGGHVGMSHPVGMNKDFPYPWVKHDDVMMTKPRNSDFKS